MTRVFLGTSLVTDLSASAVNGHEDRNDRRRYSEYGNSLTQHVAKDLIVLNLEQAKKCIKRLVAKSPYFYERFFSPMSSDHSSVRSTFISFPDLKKLIKCHF